MEVNHRDGTQQVLNQLRARISRYRMNGAAPSAQTADDDVEVAQDLRALHEGYDGIFRVEAVSQGTLLGYILTLLRRVRRRLLAPILLPQVAHNAATTRLMTRVLAQLNVLDERCTDAAEPRQSNLDELQVRVRQQEERILQLETLIRQLGTGLRAQQLAAAIPLGSTEEPLDDDLYAALEDAVRGPQAHVKEGCRIYLAILKGAGLGSAAMPVLDLGSGRGEWLELLQEEGLRGHGVDRNHSFVEAGRARGLPIVEADALAYLRSVPSASIGAVTGFHILEHLTYAQIVTTLDETVRVLKPGGVAIFETPDPENVWVSSHFFYIDPTHRRPLPSTTLGFLATARGLQRVEIRRLHPFPETLRLPDDQLEVTRRFNAHFYGPQDYALIGWKLGE